VGVLAVLCVVGVGLQTSASASPLELYGFGARSSSMAGSGAGSARGFDCVYLNPACLAQVRHKSLSAGIAYGSLQLKIDGADSNADDTVATTFGLVVPLRLGGPFKKGLTLGLAAMVPQRAIARARAPEVGKPTFALLDSRSEIVGIQGALGYNINRKWSIGFGVLALATLEGNIRIDVDGAGRFITRSEQELKSDFSPVLGVKYANPANSWHTGVTLRDSSQAGFDIEITNDLGSHLPLALPTFEIVGAPQYDPATLAAEFVYDANPTLQVAAQLDYKRWSAYPLPTRNPIVANPQLPDPGFHDTVVPRASLEWYRPGATTHLHARAGYAFFYSPAPEMSGQQSLLDNHRHVGALGLGVGWPDSPYPFQLDLWMQWHQLVSRTHKKDPSAFSEDMPPPFASVRGSGRIVIGGVLLGVKL
jgi:long-chain fatty acid transport protein